jgi:hypothetical protein
MALEALKAMRERGPQTFLSERQYPALSKDERDASIQAFKETMQDLQMKGE